MQVRCTPVLSFDRADDARASMSPRVNFVPLIDVVLQIICFYLFVSAGVQAYSDSSIELPRLNSPLLAEQLPAMLTINLAADGAIDVNGRPIRLEQLRSELETARSDAARTGQRLVVAIRADRRQRFAAMDQLLRACRGAQVPIVTIRSITMETEP